MRGGAGGKGERGKVREGRGAESREGRKPGGGRRGAGGLLCHPTTVDTPAEERTIQENSTVRNGKPAGTNIKRNDRVTWNSCGTPYYQQ